jgi:hypothetical protein
MLGVRVDVVSDRGALRNATISCVKEGDPG